MTLARRLEIIVGIPAWIIMAAAMFLREPGEKPPIWGFVALCIFFLVWTFRFLSEEKKFFRD
ncbi:hypothetical protein IDJ81_00075 [Tsuneonella flava]|uniref:Uncharacterized protein n=1 Tax=Tsuneonella flava TaxID=2055955 RepID=A0ABX7K8S8_9SPHN|nr:hypothetical protein [Tsuneonella flava]QSB44640.1 hypothetical protein IDJ81_00075 [Tsuneonella flava]